MDCSKRGSAPDANRYASFNQRTDSMTAIVLDRKFHPPESRYKYHSPLSDTAHSWVLGRPRFQQPRLCNCSLDCFGLGIDQWRYRSPLRSNRRYHPPAPYMAYRYKWRSAAPLLSLSALQELSSADSCKETSMQAHCRTTKSTRRIRMILSRPYAESSIAAPYSQAHSEHDAIGSEAFETLRRQKDVPSVRHETLYAQTSGSTICWTFWLTLALKVYDSVPQAASTCAWNASSESAHAGVQSPVKVALSSNLWAEM